MIDTAQALASSALSVVVAALLLGARLPRHALVALRGRYRGR